MAKSKWIRELERFDQVKIADEEFIFDWMDWMYAKLIDSYWDIINATWYVKKINWFYEFVDIHD